MPIERGESPDGVVKGPEAVLFAHLATAVIGLPLAFFFPPALSPQSAAGILTLGIVQLGVPYILYGLLGGAMVLISVTGWCVWRDHFVASHCGT